MVSRKDFPHLMSTDHIGFQIRTLSNLISRKINQMVSEEEENLTANQSWVLDYLTLHQEQDIMQRDIEKKFSIRRSTASHMLQLMEKNGLIYRQSVAKDARLKQLKLTPKAIAANQRVEERIDRMEAKLIRDVAEEDLEIFYMVLERMKKNLGE